MRTQVDRQDAADAILNAGEADAAFDAGSGEERNRLSINDASP